MDGPRWHEHAKMKMSLGDYYEAESLLRNAIQFDDELPGVYEDLALSLIHQGKFEEGLDTYKLILERTPSIDSQILYAGLLLMMERPKDAEQEFSQILKEDPGNRDAKKGLADSYFRQLNFRRSLELYDELLNQTPDDAFLWFSKAETLYRFQDHEASYEAIERAIELEEIPEFFAFKGDFFIRHDNYNRALEQYRLAANLDRNNPEIRMRLGFIYRILDRLKDALNEFDKAFSLDKSYLEALRNKIEILEMLADPAAALATRELLVKTNPDDLETGLLLIDEYMTNGGYSRSAELLELLSDHHDDVEIWSRLTVCMIELRQFQRAKQALNRLEEIDDKLYEEWNSIIAEGLKTDY